MASELAEHVNKMVNEIFAKFKVEKSGISQYKILHGELTCMQFTFSSDFSSLYINYLSTCGDGRNGKSLMELMDRLAASIPNLKYIELLDISELLFCNENINLAYLKILTSENADSWYGSLGYKAPTDVPDKIHNKRIRNMTVDEALSDRDRVSQSEYDRFKHQSNELFPNLETDKMSVKDYVNTIFDSIRAFKKHKDQCNIYETEKAEFVNTIIYALGKLLINGGKKWREPPPRLKKPNASISSGMPGSVSSGTISGKPYAIMIPGAGFGGRTKKRRASRKRGKSRRN